MHWPSTLLHWYFSRTFLLPLVTLPGFASEQRQHVKCYSCMSEIYKAVWDQMQRNYKAQQNFTAACDEDGDRRQLSTVPCSTMCMLLVERVHLGGAEKHAYIRGCHNDLTVRAFSEKFLFHHNYSNKVCQNYNHRTLFATTATAEPFASVYVCTCSSDFCNRGIQCARHSGAALIWTLLLILRSTGRSWLPSSLVE